jgi:hypothetical protein
MTDTPAQASEDAIRLRSYLIWEREGRREGKDLDHWLRAKAELESERRADAPPRRAKASKSRKK